MLIKISRVDFTCPHYHFASKVPIWRDCLELPDLRPKLHSGLIAIKAIIGLSQLLPFEPLQNHLLYRAGLRQQAFRLLRSTNASMKISSSSNEIHINLTDSSSVTNGSGKYPIERRY